MERTPSEGPPAWSPEPRRSILTSEASQEGDRLAWLQSWSASSSNRTNGRTDFAKMGFDKVDLRTLYPDWGLGQHQSHQPSLRPAPPFLQSIYFFYKLSKMFLSLCKMLWMYPHTKYGNKYQADIQSSFLDLQYVKILKYILRRPALCDIFKSTHFA